MFSHSTEYEYQHSHTHCLGDKIQTKSTPGVKTNNGSILSVSQNTSDLLIYDEVWTRDTECTVDESSNSQVDSKLSNQITDHTDSCSFNAEVLAACQTTEYAKTHEKVCFSKLLEKDTLSGNHAGALLENQTDFSEAASANVDNNVEIYLGKSFITFEESDDDDDNLEYLECSDLMTEEAYQNWEEKLRFLLESEDEEGEFILGSECDGCAYFLGDMPRLRQVSDNTVPMDATIGFCDHQSKSKEVAVRSDLAAYNPSTLQTEMTLMVGHQQSKTSTMKDKEKYKLPVASTAIENDYPRAEEENSGHNPSAVDAVHSHGTENGISEMKCFPCDFAGSSRTASKQASRKNLQRLTKVRKKPTEGKTSLGVVSPTRTSKDGLNLLHPKELHTSEIYTVQKEKNYSDTAAQLHGLGASISHKGEQEVANASNTLNQIGLYHGEGKDKSSPHEGKWIPGLSEGTRMPNENAALMGDQQETIRENTSVISSDIKLFISEPAPDERIVFESSPEKSVPVDSESSALVKTTSKNGFEMDRSRLENNTGLCVSNGAQNSNKQEPSWNQAQYIATMDTIASCDTVPDDLSHPVITSKQQGILAPIAVHDMQKERRKACREKSYEANKVKTDQGTLCAKYLSKGDFQRALASPEPKVTEDDLSSMHEQLQKLLYVEEDWACDLPCTISEGEDPAAVTDTAKEVRGWNITSDGRAGQHVPGNSAEDNQLVTELASAMEVHSDSNSLLKTDEACNGTSTGQCSFALSVETDAGRLCSALRCETEKSSDHLLQSNLQKEKDPENKYNGMQLDHRGSVQPLRYREGMIISDNAFQSCQAESSYRFVEGSGSPLKQNQEISSDLPVYYLGQLPSVKQHIRRKNSPIVKQSDEMPMRKSQAALHQSRINEGTKLAELSLKEDLFSNFSGKNTDQFTREKHSSVAAVSKSTEEKFQEKGTESEWNEPSNSNSSIYHALKNNDSKNVQIVDDAQNYSYHMQEPNSRIATDSKVYRDEPEVSGPNNKARKEEPVFTASYKVRFFTEVLLQIKNDKNSMKEEHRESGESSGPTALESKHVLKMPSCSQSRASENNSSTAGHFCSSDKGLDFTSFPSQPYELAALNVVQPSSILKNECRTDQDSQGGKNTVDNEKQMYKSGNANVLGIVGSLLQTEPLENKIKKDRGTEISELWQGQHQRVKEGSRTQVVRYEGERQMSVVRDIEEAEVEPYMRALIDIEQAPSWHDGIKLQQDEYEKVEQEKEILCERDARETEKSIECHLEEAEIEPYMRALINSNQMHSWHDSPHFVHSLMDFADEELGVAARGLVGECTITSRNHNRAAAFKDDERQILNSPECAMGTSSSTSSSVSENRRHSEEQLAQVKIQQGTVGAAAEDLCILKAEKTKPQGASKLHKAPSPHSSAEDVKRKQEMVKKKVMPKGQIKRQRIETKENVFNNTSCVKKNSKAEADLSQKEDKKEPRKLTCKKDSKAPLLLKKIQAEPFLDSSGNIKLCCQFGEICEESVITWTKDSKLLARVHRSAGDDFPVSLAIVQAGEKDQGMYQCCLKNMYGKATADFNLTAEVLEHLSSFHDVEGLEEIEFLQLMFRDDFICDSYLSKSLHGRITTEELHFGEGVHRKAFRSKVMQGLVPVFSPGHPCVLKVHNAIVYGTKNKDELVKKNYKLALQECYVQNTAREYAKIYAAETKPLEGFGEVPEIIPIFLVHRPKNNIPYATVEEELIGEFVKYSVKDGKEINFMRKDSEAGQKCCTFQHWIYERTNGSLLVTDMQGVGMKLTDVGIATPAKGYKGFKGNCSISFIDQFMALHQCNKYCEMLGLKPLQSSNQKQRKPAAPRIKALPSSSTVKKTVASAPTAKKT
ncbi:alpha-protein kinase 2 [Pogona vitticeps]